MADNRYANAKCFVFSSSLSPFRMVCRNFILPEFCKPCLFYFCETYSTLSAQLLCHFLLAGYV